MDPEFISRSVKNLSVMKQKFILSTIDRLQPEIKEEKKYIDTVNGVMISLNNLTNETIEQIYKIIIKYDE